MKEAKLKVKLLSCTKNPERVAAAAIRQCYSPDWAPEIFKELSAADQERLIKMVISSGHTSTLEHASFTFAVDGVSRVTEIQLIRHRLASYSIQSGRYLKRSEVGYAIPESIKNFEKTKPALFKNYSRHLDNSQKIYNELLANGIAAEDARYCQPQSLQVKIVFTMNARELLHFFQVRTCRRAQWEIRELAERMLKLAKKAAPALFASAGPTCETEKICWEGKFSCGRWKELKGGELRER